MNDRLELVDSIQVEDRLLLVFGLNHQIHVIWKVFRQRLASVVVNVSKVLTL